MLRATHTRRTLAAARGLATAATATAARRMLDLPPSWEALVARAASAPPSELLREGRAVAADAAAPVDARRRWLRWLLRIVSPGRKRVAAAGDAAVRRTPGEATLEELLAALELDLAPLLRREASAAGAAQQDTPYRLAERRFRPPPGPAADSKRASVVFSTLDGVRTAREAVAAGALDLSAGAAWRADAALQAALGIVRLPLLAPGAPEVLGLECAPGFYVLPGYLAAPEQEALAAAVLTRYAERPNRRNVDAPFDPDASNLIMLAAGEPRGGDYGRAASSVLSVAAAAATDGGGGGGGAAPAAATAAAARGAAGAVAAAGEGAAGLRAAPPAFPAGLWQQHVEELETRSSRDPAHFSLEELETRAAAAGGCDAGQLPPCGGDDASDDGRGGDDDDGEARLDLLLAPSRHGWLSKLTWSTLGHQYDWTSRQYHLPGDPDYALHAHAHDAAGGAATSAAEAAGAAAPPPAPGGSHRWHAPFPADLRRLCERLADHAHAAVAAAHAAAGGDAAAAAARGLPLAPFDAQSGICNCYQYGPHGRPLRGVPMGGHRDDMERRQDRPVLSFSVGCAAVFLLGGSRKEDAPVPVLVRSGDALLLSGASRLAFHGVARVFDASAPGELFAPLAAAAASPRERLERAALRAFVRHARLNVNVRQVE